MKNFEKNPNKNVILKELNVLMEIPPDSFLTQRIDKYDQMGVFSDS